jgi:hypothetical protein
LLVISKNSVLSKLNMKYEFFKKSILFKAVVLN